MKSISFPIDKSRLDRLNETEATLHARMLELIGEEDQCRRLVRVAKGNLAAHDSKANREDVAAQEAHLREAERKLQEARSAWSNASQLAASCRAHAKAQGITA